jgi:hypothetical protein
MNNITDYRLGPSLEQICRSVGQESGESMSIHPLSHGQRALWILDQLAPESAANNVAVVARIRSELNPSTLKLALQSLINRHASLRTTFALHGTELVQEVHAFQEAYFEQVDAATWDDRELNIHLEAAFRRSFDLAQGPLLRMSLFSRSTTDHTLLFAAHHLVFDGWSAGICIREGLALYEAMISGIPPSLPALSRPYTAFV